MPDTVNGFKFVRDLYEKSKDKSGMGNAAAGNLIYISPCVLVALVLACWVHLLYSVMATSFSYGY